ncbi:hypothetical protein HYS97_01825 [Candidatus Daviesbacteria bacterium]|nr:hypothetical protein [Candidatus Daviesbacteria bacterium]
MNKLVHGLWFMVHGKIFLLLFLFLLLTINSKQPTIFAQESSQSGKTASKSATLTEKINALIKESASKAAALKTEVHKKLENKAVAGKVSFVQGSKIILKNTKGDRTILVTEYTQYQTGNQKPSKSLSFKNVKEEDFIVALGDIDDKSNLNAKKIVFLDNYKTQEKFAVWGQVQSVVGNVLNLKDKNGKPQKVILRPGTEIRLGNEEASRLDLKPNSQVIAVGSEFIYIATRGGKPKPEVKSATTSASQSL